MQREQRYFVLKFKDLEEAVEAGFLQANALGVLWMSLCPFLLIGKARARSP